MPQHDVVASFTRVSKRYGTTEALRDVDLGIRAGEAVALLGPNGAANTTAVNLLLGILTPSSARVRVFGNDPNNRASRQRLGAMLQIAGVPQTPPVREHVELFRSYYPDPLGHATIIATTPDEIKRATSRSRIAAVTKLERATVDALPNVTRIRQSTIGTDCTEIFASRSEPVVRQLLAPDPRLRDLEVTRTPLEEALLALTQSDHTEHDGLAEPPPNSKRDSSGAAPDFGP